jgi:uncharacterized phage-like protein YoqJ
VPVACFTGHRPNKLGTGYSITNNRVKTYSNLMLPTIVKLIEEKSVDTFITGGALGVDQIAYWTIHKLQRQGYRIKNILAIPYKDQPKIWRNTELVRWYYEMIRRADEVVFVDTLPNYKIPHVPEGVHHNLKLQRRNEYMVDRSDYVIAVWNGSPGGTENCVKYALRLKKNIVHIDPSELMKIYCNQTNV